MYFTLFQWTLTVFSLHSALGFPQACLVFDEEFNTEKKRAMPAHTPTVHLMSIHLFLRKFYFYFKTVKTTWCIPQAYSVEYRFIHWFTHNSMQIMAENCGNNF